MLKVYSIPTNRTCFARDSQLVQGREPWITTYARNFALLARSIMANSGGLYDGAVDMNCIVKAFTVEGADGSSIEAKPWEDSTDTGETTAQFEQQLAECEGTMEHLSNYTPSCFLRFALKRKRSEEGDDEPATRAYTGWSF